MTPTTRIYGKLNNGLEVTEFTLSNAKGFRLKVINYGCTITSLVVPDRNGNLGDIVLGYDSLGGYTGSPHYMGAIIGRYANRIAEGKFSIDSKSFALSKNEMHHHLHGGIIGFDKTIWQAKPFETAEGSGVDFYYASPDGEEGYPGNLNVNVRYFLANDSALILTYVARTDKSTIINLTQHSYFNLNGGKGNVLAHLLDIHSNYFLPVDNKLIPTGEIHHVENTPFDFREMKAIGKDLKEDYFQLKYANGYDHNWILQKSGEELAQAATLHSPESGRTMEIHTTEPGLQLYTGNSLEGLGKNNVTYHPHSGVCLETQHFPDSPHHPDFPNVQLNPGETYQSTTVLLFSTQ